MGHWADRVTARLRDECGQADLASDAEMSTWLDPVGPRSRAVYWRRRVVVSASVLLLVYLGTRACGSDQPPDLGINSGLTQTPVPLVSTYTPSPTTTPTPTPTPTLTEPATPAETAATATLAETVACAQTDIEVGVRADARRYAPKVNPRLFISVVNRGAAPCRFDVGSRSLSLVVSSGKDRVWSSDDCQGKGSSDVRLLEPGKPFAAAAVWKRVRSAEGCPKGQPVARPGTYVVSGSANGVENARKAVFLLA
jgi:hypothetical protein